MKKSIISLVLIVSMLLPSTATGEEASSNIQLSASQLPQTPPDEPNPGPAISPLKKSKIAPFTGLLLSPAAVASIIADINAKDQAMKIEIDRVKKELSAKHDFEMKVEKDRHSTDNEILNSRLLEKNTEISDLSQSLKKERDSRPSRATWGMIGAAGGILFSAVTAALIVKISN